MVCTTPATTWPPCVTVCAAEEANWLAWRALSAFWRTVLVSCSIEAAVSCSELARCSVRGDRLWLPASRLAGRRGDAVGARARHHATSWHSSPAAPAGLASLVVRVDTCTRLVRSLAATARATCTACASGCVMPRVNHRGRRACRCDTEDAQHDQPDRLLHVGGVDALRRGVDAGARCMSSSCWISAGVFVRGGQVHLGEQALGFFRPARGLGLHDLGRAAGQVRSRAFWMSAQKFSSSLVSNASMRFCSSGRLAH